MIDREEIVHKSNEFDINTSNVQRDYVFGWFLSGIYLGSELKDHFILKGGNCFRKAYFENTRFSNDLDFSIESDLSSNYIKSELDKVCDYVHEFSGVVFEKFKNRVDQKKRVDPSKKVYDARIYFNDFYGIESKIIISIRLDITRFDKIHLPIQKRKIIHPYSDYKQCSSEIRCIKLEELLAAKFKCLLQRRHVADLYDYIFSIFIHHDLEIDRTEVISTLLKMTIYSRSPGILKDFFVELPFEFFKRFWSKYIVCPIHGRIEFDQAIDVFKDHVSELFGQLSLGRGEMAFFPAKMRNLILDAGAGMNLLQIQYGGYDRIVEPYSLSYKNRQDGASNEYLYVWDRSGGSSGRQGIKAFFHHRIKDIRIMDETFEPRFEVELAKAGEKAKTSYFGKGFSDRKRKTRIQSNYKKPTRRSSSGFTGYSGPTYIIECPICNKRFKRSIYSTKLNNHKDKYGNQCYGRVGYMVDTRY